MARFEALALILWMFAPTVAWSAFEHKPAGARNAAMGGISAAGGTDGWGTTDNPALLLRSNSRLLGASLTPGMFEIADLSLVQAMMVLPMEGIGIGCSFSRFGSAEYRESQGSLSLAAGLSGNASFGASLQVFHLGISGYGENVAMAINLGLTVQPSATFLLAIAMTNCGGSSLGACRVELPRSLAAAVEWSPAEPLCTILEFRKESGFPMTVSWGGELCVAGVLNLRLGCTTEYPGVSVGGGILCSPIRLDYAWRWHASLGGTHSLGVTFEGLF